MRWLTYLVSVAVLVTHLAPLEARQEGRQQQPQPMTPSEDARLAARAARTPQLEKFTAGQDGEACIYLLFFVAVVAFSITVGQVIGLPLGWTHSSQGRGFVPADSLSGNSKTVNYFNGCGVIAGFHFYAVGYLIGLALGPASPPPPKPVPLDPRDLEKYFIASTIDVEGSLKIVALSDAAGRAGLQLGDLILDVDDEEVDHVNLPSVLSNHAKAGAVQVGILREGCRLRMTVVTKE